MSERCGGAGMPFPDSATQSNAIHRNDTQTNIFGDAAPMARRVFNKRVSAPWMWTSVYDTTRFVLHKYTAHATAKERKAAAAILERLATFAKAD